MGDPRMAGSPCAALSGVLVRTSIAALPGHMHRKLPGGRCVFRLQAALAWAVQLTGSTSAPLVLSVLMKNDQLLFPTFGSGRPERNQ